MTRRGRASSRDEVDDRHVDVPGSCPAERDARRKVPAMGSLSIFHVGVLVDDRHHVAHGLGVAFEHLPP